MFGIKHLAVNSPVLRAGLVVLGWGTTIGGIVLTAMFQGLLLPTSAQGVYTQVNTPTSGPLLFYLAIFGVSTVGGIVLEDVGVAVLSFFLSYALGGTIIFLVLALPAYLGLFAFANALYDTAIVFAFAALFPLPLLLGLIGTIIGVWLAERFS
jgi:hypothetical protein